MVALVETSLSREQRGVGDIPDNEFSDNRDLLVTFRAPRGDEGRDFPLAIR